MQGTAESFSPQLDASQHVGSTFGMDTGFGGRTLQGGVELSRHGGVLSVQILGYTPVQADVRHVTVSAIVMLRGHQHQSFSETLKWLVSE